METTDLMGISQHICLYNNVNDGRLPSDFLGRYHIHILCLDGKMDFLLDGRRFTAGRHELVIWQMSSEVCDVTYSPDFQADFLLVSPGFLGRFNPEMAWAVRGFVFIKRHPAFRLGEEGLALCRENFALIRRRLAMRHLFGFEVLGRLLQIFLFDLWEIYSEEINAMQVRDNAAIQFFRFLELVRAHCRTQREVAFYADKLCVTPKYLSELCRKVSDLPASEWIDYYASYEIRKLLDDPALTLTDIADRMHFYNLSHFSRYAKRMLGLSPAEYRHRSKERDG